MCDGYAWLKVMEEELRLDLESHALVKRALEKDKDASDRGEAEPDAPDKV
jgi:hypothetical protein